MKKFTSVCLAACLSALMLAGCGKPIQWAPNLTPSIITEEEAMNSLQLIEKTDAVSGAYKDITYGNPISPIQYCADPTAVEYNGRLYVYGTNDHQQFDAVGEEGKNTYEHIRSLVVMSTEDMVNWTFHGEIPVGEIAPWIWASWAPTICSRVEEDGLTHFYLYFSNSGGGVGVITSTDPVTGWTDPLGKPFIDGSTLGLGECPNPFDPGVCIDDNGVGWLSFGAGIGPNGTEAMPGSARIVQLGDDMLSFASDIVEIKAPYLFEASELNYINGTYVYTYNNSWAERTEWNYDADVPPGCSMAYMTTKTPLDTDSWVYEDYYFTNPGEAGMSYSNNHSHLHKYKDNWYLFYHTLNLQDAQKIKVGVRSLSVEEIKVNEGKVKIERTQASHEGAAQIMTLDPFASHSGAEMATCMRMDYIDTPDSKVAATSSVSLKSGAWLMLRGVDFSKTPEEFWAVVSGSGQIEIRLDDRDSDSVAGIRFEDAASATVMTSDIAKITGTHDIYFLFSGEGITLEGWQFK